MVVTVSTPPLNRNGYIQPVESGYFQLNLSGYNQTFVPKSDSEIALYAKSLPTDDVISILQNADPVGNVEPFQRSRNIRISYDEVCLRMAAWRDHCMPKTSRVCFQRTAVRHAFNEDSLLQMCLPDGICIIGDAVCAFNPVYGQGMTMAAQGAFALNDLLAERISTTSSIASQRKSLKGLNKVSCSRLPITCCSWWPDSGATRQFSHPDRRLDNFHILIADFSKAARSAP